MLQEANPILKWSAQQQAYLDWCANGQGSCVLIAVAGAGKSSVLRESVRHLSGQVAMVCFGKDPADENKAALAAMGIDWKKGQAGTTHSFGFAAVRKASPNVKLDDNKVRNLLDAHIQHPTHPLYPFRAEVTKLVGLAKQMAIGVPGVGGAISDNHVWLEMADHFDIFDDEGPNPPVDAIIGMAQQILTESNQDLEVIDYSDMVYLPLIHKLKMWQFQNVLVDEAQDINPARRAFIRALLRRGGRLIAVGDPRQAIFGFTGADVDALELIKADFNAIELPLTVSFRCPQKVVKFAHQWVSHIESAPNAPEGMVDAIDFDPFMKRNDLTGGSAVLCRNNKPLVALAFKFIRQRIPCRVEGRDIGAGITKLLTRWKVTTLDALEKKLDDYLARQTTKLLAAKKEQKLAEIEDQVETARVIIDQCRAEKRYSIQDAVAYVDGLFGDKITNMLVLTSIHKAKGREWNTVFWLDRAGTCPSRWARQAWQQEQEKNLCYVAATRSKDQLIEVTAMPEE